MGKIRKVEKELWISVKIPERVWHLVKVSATANRRKIYEEIENKFK